MLRLIIARRPAGVAFLVVGAACATARSASPPPVTADAPSGAPSLPPVPLVEGPLGIHVQYPAANALVEARDSSFILGHVGNGRATLAINGFAVPVLPNGSFLAFLPLPRPDSARFDLIAVLGADTVRVSHPIRLAPPRPILTLDGPLVVDTASLTPPPGLMLRAAERVRVGVRAPANASVWVELDTSARASSAAQRCERARRSCDRAGLVTGARRFHRAAPRHPRVVGDRCARGNAHRAAPSRRRTGTGHGASRAAADRAH